MRVIADNDICGAHGACAMVDDELFQLDDDGYIAIGDGERFHARFEAMRLSREEGGRLGPEPVFVGSEALVPLRELALFRNSTSVRPWSAPVPSTSYHFHITVTWLCRGMR